MRDPALWAIFAAAVYYFLMALYFPNHWFVAGLAWGAFLTCFQVAWADLRGKAE